MIPFNVCITRALLVFLTQEMMKSICSFLPTINNRPLCPPTILATVQLPHPLLTYKMHHLQNHEYHLRTTPTTIPSFLFLFSNWRCVSIHSNSMEIEYRETNKQLMLLCSPLLWNSVLKVQKFANLYVETVSPPVMWFMCIVHFHVNKSTYRWSCREPCMHVHCCWNGESNGKLIRLLIGF